jgi:hypothetical protein
MPFVLNPSRNKTLQLAYALKDAEDRKAKKAAKEPEPAEPVKKQPARKGKKT